MSVKGLSERSNSFRLFFRLIGSWFHGFVADKLKVLPPSVSRSKRRLTITFVYFVSHASAQALQPITFTQRFRTTRHLFSIQLLRKPKILNVEDKQTKFECSKGDLLRVSELCKLSLTQAQFLRCWWMKATDIPADLRQSVTSLVYKLYTDMLF